LTALLIWFFAKTISDVQKPPAVLTPVKVNPSYQVFKSSSEEEEQQLRDQYKTAPTADQTKAQEYYLSGLKKFQAGNYTGAQTDWKKASSLDPKNIEVREALLRVKKRVGKTQ